MASKAIYTVVAVVGIAAASGAAWWFQHKPAKTATQPAAAGSPSPAASGA
ncbi:MAG TPA: efflux transporter periplasmic adaptor subunit, partial [Ramlibacter sp.]|nr:efflux transporter periplasmic adaptor subunit [Ramlibacter sp.]